MWVMLGRCLTGCPSPWLSRLYERLRFRLSVTCMCSIGRLLAENPNMKQCRRLLGSLLWTVLTCLCVLDVPTVGLVFYLNLTNIRVPLVSEPENTCPMFDSAVSDLLIGCATACLILRGAEFGHGTRTKVNGVLIVGTNLSGSWNVVTSLIMVRSMKNTMAEIGCPRDNLVRRMGLLLGLGDGYDAESLLCVPGVPVAAVAWFVAYVAAYYWDYE